MSDLDDLDALFGPAPTAPAPVADNPPAIVGGAAEHLDLDDALAIDALTPQEFKFLAAYVECGNRKQAAKRAGFINAPNSRRVQAAMTAVHRALSIQFGYDITAAFADIAEAMDFARDRGNAMAVAKLVELKAKVVGLLTERVSGKVTHEHTHELVDNRTDAELLAHAADIAKRLAKAGAVDGEFVEVKHNGE